MRVYGGIWGYVWCARCASSGRINAFRALPPGRYENTYIHMNEYGGAFGRAADSSLEGSGSSFRGPIGV